MPLYTPFFEDVSKTLVSGQQQRDLNKLAGSAYMGDQAAMEQLMRTNPDVGIKIQQTKQREQQQALQSATQAQKSMTQDQAQKRQIYLQNKNLMDGIFKNAATLDNYDQAKNYIQEQFDQNRQILGDHADTSNFTPQAFDQIKKIYGKGVTQNTMNDALKQAIRDSKVDAKNINSATLPMWNDLAQSGALPEGKTPNQNLLQSFKDGFADPSKINSRNITMWNAIADAHINATAAHASIEAKTKAYKDSVAYAAAIKRTTSIVDKNMPLLVDLADKVNKTGFPIIDRGYTKIKAKSTNDPDVVKYVNLLTTLRTEYANMLARNGVVTEPMRQEATNAIPSGLSGAAYQALQTQLDQEGRQAISAANETAQSILIPKAGEPPIQQSEQQPGQQSQTIGRFQVQVVQ